MFPITLISSAPHNARESETYLQLKKRLICGLRMDNQLVKCFFFIAPHQLWWACWSKRCFLLSFLRLNPCVAHKFHSPHKIPFFFTKPPRKLFSFKSVVDELLMTSKRWFMSSLLKCVININTRDNFLCAKINGPQHNMILPSDIKFRLERWFTINTQRHIYTHVRAHTEKSP